MRKEKPLKRLSDGMRLVRSPQMYLLIEALMCAYAKKKEREKVNMFPDNLLPVSAFSMFGSMRQVSILMPWRHTPEYGL